MACIKWQIAGSDDQLIYGSSDIPEAGVETRGALLMAHGLMGYKDYGFLPYLGKRLCKALDFAVHRFNFSHSGMTHDYQRFEKLELFEKDNWGRQIEDFHAVDLALRQGRLPGGDQLGNRYWLGHSRGGLSAVLAADRSALPPTGLICLSSPSSACNLDASQIQRLKKSGGLGITSGRTGQVLRTGRQWIDAIEADGQGFDPLLALAAVVEPMRGRVLLIHGDQDTTVPSQSMAKYQGACGGRCQTRLITGANHVYNCVNPLDASQGVPQALETLISAVSSFISKD